MITITDYDDVKGEFGSIQTLNFFSAVADSLGMRYLSNFLDLGMTVDVREVIQDVEAVDWPTVDGMNIVAGRLVEALSKVRGIAFLE